MAIARYRYSNPVAVVRVTAWGSENGISRSAGVRPPTHTGMTSDEFDRIAKDWFATARHPRFNRPNTELAYQPMVELVVCVVGPTTLHGELQQRSADQREERSSLLDGVGRVIVHQSGDGSVLGSAPGWACSAPRRRPSRFRRR